MWADSDEARSDFVLAAAAAILVTRLVVPLLLSIPALRRPVAGAFVLAVLWFAALGLVPLLLARHRRQGAAAFGLDVAARPGLVAGVVVAVPVVLLAVVTDAVEGRFDVGALAGIFGELGGGTLPVAAAVVQTVARAAGAALLYPFLTAKARDGFRGTEVSQLQALRTFGLATIAAATVLGLLLSAGRRVGLANVLLVAVALVAVLLLADRVVEAGQGTTRATVLAPAIVALVANLEIFGGALLATLYVGLLAAAVVLVAAVLVETRRYAWAAVPLLVLVVVYDTRIPV